MKALLRGTLTSLLGVAAIFVAPAALADGEPCINDTDCPGTECGSAVCNWNKPQGAMFTCNPAGTDPPVGGKPKDGWCTTSDNCKCKAQGATCATAPYCTFTTPPAGSGGSGTGGSTSSTAGTTSTAGTGTTPTAGTGTTPTAGTGSKPAEEESGGCSVSVPGGANSALALGVGLAGLGFALARRRRR